MGCTVAGISQKVAVGGGVLVGSLHPKLCRTGSFIASQVKAYTSYTWLVKVMYDFRNRAWKVESVAAQVLWNFLYALGAAPRTLTCMRHEWVYQGPAEKHPLAFVARGCVPNG